MMLDEDEKRRRAIADYWEMLSLRAFIAGMAERRAREDRQAAIARNQTEA